MIPLILIVSAAVATAGVVMASRAAGTVYPFAPTTPTADDTVAVAAETVFADDGWQCATLSNLSEVEDLLDCLEAQKFAQREVLTLGNASFRVRWR